MATVVLDTVRDAEIGIENTRVSLVRTGYIKDFDVSGSAEDIFARAVDTSGLPLRFSSHPYFAPATLQRYQFTTQQGNNHKIWFKLFYETPEGRNPAGDSLFTLERHRQLVSVQTQRHPKDWSDLELRWVNPNNANDSRPIQAATMEYLQPQLTLTATGYIIGEPPDTYVSEYGKVNKTEWQGYPKGYWLYMGADDVTRDYGNSYTIRLSFLTRVIEDWSSAAAYKDHSTGLFLPVKKTDANALRTASYFYGAVNLNGILKVGFYDLAEFNTIFGF